MKLPRWAGTVGLGLTIYCALSLFYQLGVFPALTGDEAWLGIYALRLKNQGLITPHAMNTYTGPFFGMAMGQLMSIFAIDVAHLRLFGALCNATAFILVAAYLRRRVNVEASTWWALILSGSAYLLLKSRLAWEVYALQPLLITLTLLLMQGPITVTKAFVLSSITLFGIVNHFIYLSVPVSLILLSAIESAWHKNDPARAKLKFAVCSLLSGSIIFIVKPQLSEENWPAQKIWAVPAFFALIFLNTLLSNTGEWEIHLVNFLRQKKIRNLLTRFIMLGLIAFLVWHGLAIWQVFANTVVWERIYSWDCPWWLSIFSGLWSLFALGIIVWRSMRAWFGIEKISENERMISLWPMCYAAIFIFFRNTSSLRYYSLIQFMSLISLAVGLTHIAKKDLRTVLASVIILALITQGVFWKEISYPTDRKPQTFKIGWHSENSWDFANKEKLFSAWDTSNACTVAHHERSFVALPLDFHRAQTGPLSCDPIMAFDADMCRDCVVSPYYRWSTIKQ